MPFTAAEVRSAMGSKLGFAIEPTGKHVFFRYRVDGRIVASTHISHGRKPVSDGIISAMAKELGMHGRGPLLRGAIDCRVSAESFLAELLDSRK